MARFVGRPDAQDSFFGTDAADEFLFRAQDLDGDVVVGGDGPAVDLLQITAPGAVSELALRNVSGIEAIALADGGCSIVVTNLMASTAFGESITVSGGSGNDTVDGSGVFGGTLTLRGLDGDDRLSGGEGSDILSGDSGRDRVAGGYGADRITYDAMDLLDDGGDGGSDTLVVTGAAYIDLSRSDQSLGDAAIVSGFEQVDASTSHQSVHIKGSDGPAFLTGGFGDDVIVGGSYTNTITGGRGADHLIGGDGEDFFNVMAGDFAAGEIIDGGGFYDHLSLYGSSDLTIGTVRNVESVDIHVAANGSAANVTITSSFLNSLVEVRSADDAVSSLTVKLDGRTSDLAFSHIDGIGDKILVRVIGTAGDDTFYGDASHPVTLFGGAGDDQIGAGQGGQVYGGVGDDRIHFDFNYSSQRIDGGSGSDTLWNNWQTRDTSEELSFNLSAQANQLVGGQADAVVTHIENLDFSTSGVHLTAVGDRGANILVGGYNSDLIDGGAGNDLIDGGTAMLNNVVLPDADQLTGGQGADTFRWTTRTGDDATHDVVTDFGEGADRLAFAERAFKISGPDFDVRKVVTASHQGIAGADLIVDKTGALNGVADVRALLASSHGAVAGDGAFVVGTNDHGDTLLFHVADASRGQASDVVFVADLGTGIAADHVTLGTFLFV